MKNIITTAFLAIMLFATIGAKAQWEIPEDAKNTKSPTEATIESALIGKKLYNQNCISCHGTPTQADGILPTATDLGSDAYFARTEGETFYQITSGMGAMPSFAETLTEEERWNVVHFVQSFNPESTIDLSKAQSVNFDLNVNLNDADKSIEATISTADSAADLQGVKLEFFVKRYFGDLPITDAPVKTDSNGVAKVSFPHDIPGDEQGNLEVIVKFENADMHGDAEFRKTIAWGTHTEYENILEKRAMWGTAKKAPLWILSLYLGITGGVWLVILYVAFQLLKIKKAGKE